MVALDGSATVPAGTYDGLLVTLETTDLEPGGSRRLSWASGIGLVEEDRAGRVVRLRSPSGRIWVPESPESSAVALPDRSVLVRRQHGDRLGERRVGIRARLLRLGLLGRLLRLPLLGVEPTGFHSWRGVVPLPAVLDDRLARLPARAASWFHSCWNWSGAP